MGVSVNRFPFAGEEEKDHRSRCAFFVGAADFQISAPRLSR
jgi:hypothetical protein